MTGRDTDPSPHLGSSEKLQLIEVLKRQTLVCKRESPKSQHLKIVRRSGPCVFRSVKILGFSDSRTLRVLRLQDVETTLRRTQGPRSLETELRTEERPSACHSRGSRLRWGLSHRPNVQHTEPPETGRDKGLRARDPTRTRGPDRRGSDQRSPYTRNQGFVVRRGGGVQGRSTGEGVRDLVQWSSR